MRFFTPAFAHDSNISHLNLLYSYAKAFSNVVSISWYPRGKNLRRVKTVSVIFKRFFSSSNQVGDLHIMHNFQHRKYKNSNLRYEYLSEVEDIFEYALACQSGIQLEQLSEINLGKTSRDTVPFISCCTFKLPTEASIDTNHCQVRVPDAPNQ